MTTKEMVEKLRDFSVPELCDGMEEPRVMDYQVKPLAAGRKIVGPAYTVDAIWSERDHTGCPSGSEGRRCYGDCGERGMQSFLLGRP